MGRYYTSPFGKEWYASRTIWGAILISVFTLLRYLGIDVSPETKHSLIEVLTALGTLYGLYLVVVGRYKADCPMKRGGRRDS